MSGQWRESLVVVSNIGVVSVVVHSPVSVSLKEKEKGKKKEELKSQMKKKERGNFVVDLQVTLRRWPLCRRAYRSRGWGRRRWEGAWLLQPRARASARPSSPMARPAALLPSTRRPPATGLRVLATRGGLLNYQKKNEKKKFFVYCFLSRRKSVMTARCHFLEWIFYLILFFTV